MGATLVRLAPGFGTDEEELDSRLGGHSIQALRAANADQSSLPIFYFHYLGRLMRGDWGISHTLQRPVAELVGERFPETLKSVALGLATGWSLGFCLAAAVVMSRASYLDLLSGIVAGILLCLPAAVLALLAVIAQAPARLLLGLVIFPKVFRYSRNLLARTSAMPHVLTARAKGVGELRVFAFHVLPAATPQLLALAGVSVSLAFTSAIPLEALCDVPGIGQLAWKAALGRDVSLLLVLTMIVTLVTLLANSLPDLACQHFATRPA